MLSASFIAKKQVKFVTAAAAVLLSAGTENLASHSESIEAHTGQVHALKLNLNLQGGGFPKRSKAVAAASARPVAKIGGPKNKKVEIGSLKIDQKKSGPNRQASGTNLQAWLTDIQASRPHLKRGLRIGLVTLVLFIVFIILLVAYK